MWMIEVSHFRKSNLAVSWIGFLLNKSQYLKALETLKHLLLILRQAVSTGVVLSIVYLALARIGHYTRFCYLRLPHLPRRPPHLRHTPT